MTDTPIWWCIDINGKFLGRCYATLVEIVAAVGPYHERRGNHINVFAPSP